MAVFSFTVDQDNCNNEKLFGVTIKIRTMDYPGYKPDPPGLFQWALPFLEDVIDGRLKRKDLIEEGIHLLITSADGEVLVDAMGDRRSL